MGMVFKLAYLSGPTWMASTVHGVYKVGVYFRATCVASTVSIVFKLAYLSGPTWVASTVCMVFKVGLSFRAYMGGINCELLDELGNMYVYINISA